MSFNIVKRKILLEDFINRADSKFMSVDNTNVGSTIDNGVCSGINTNGRKNIWGKIPHDIVLLDNGGNTGDYPYSDLLNIGFHLEYMGDDYTPPMGAVISEWDDIMYSFDNIDNLYKKIESINGEIITKYYKLIYIDVLSLIEYSYEENDKQSLIHVLKYKTLLRYYRFLQYLRLNITLYRKCSERFFEIKDEYITVGEGEQNIYDKFYGKFYTIEEGGIVINSEDDIDVVDVCNGDAIPFSNIGFYSEVPTDVDGVEHDIICVSKREYVDIFNTVFRQNNKRRYECMLWDLSEKVLDGDATIRGIESHLDIPLYIEEDINSNGLFDRVSRDTFEKCTPIGENCITYEDSNIPNNDNVDMTVNAVKYSELISNFQRRIVETEDGEVLPMVIREYETPPANSHPSNKPGDDIECDIDDDCPCENDNDVCPCEEDVYGGGYECVDDDCPCENDNDDYECEEDVYGGGMSY